MASVKIAGVEKTYGETQVLRGIDIDISDGEFVTLVGPSGCGKSTLLRMIAGLETVTSGEVSIGGRIVNNVPSKSRDIAMVFQNYALYPHMTVAQNMSFAMQISKVPAAEITARVRNAAAMLGMNALLQRYPRELSGGQRQRVAMGRAVVRDPQVFLFDEPLSNLDAKLRVQMRTEIKELHERLKATMIYVTHDQIEAMTMADRIAVMNKGAIEQMGSPMELYNRPRNLFVAGFIGSPGMNMIEGTLADGGFVTRDGLRLPVRKSQPATNGTSAIYGIRPEHVSISAEGLAATVSVVEPIGPETHVVVRLAGQKVLCAFRGDAMFRPHQEVNISFDAAKVHLFEQSGNRLDAPNW